MLVMKQLHAKLVSIWEQGVEGRAPARRRETVLANQLGLLGAGTTSLYEVFYAIYDFALLWPVFAANLVFILVYLSVPLVNRHGRFALASHLAFGNVLVQLSVVTYFLSTGAGVHLFYFTLAALLALMFARIRPVTLLSVACVIAGLYTLCHFLFTPARAALPLSDSVLDVLYPGSVAGAVLLSAMFSYLFRQEIQRAEDELEQANETLLTLSAQDELTGLANRRRLDAFLRRECQRAVREGLPLAVLMIDVDYFKCFNDRHGHQAGDRCLQTVAALVNGALRRPADLAARYGGEEFVVVLPDTGLAGALGRAEALRSAVEAARVGEVEGQGQQGVTVSVGVAASDGGVPVTPEKLVAAADRGLYAAKAAGRNRTMVADDHAV